MSYRDDDAAGLARADALQHELDRSEAELSQLRAQLSKSYAKAKFSSGRVEATEAELAALRARLAKLEAPAPVAKPVVDTGLGTFVWVMCVLLLLVGGLVGMLDACNAVPRNH